MLINTSQFLRKSSFKWSAITQRSKFAVVIVALAIPLALGGAYVFNGGGKFEDFFAGKSAISAGPGTGMASRLSAVGTNLMGALGLRSPGERSQGQLADAKGGLTRHRPYAPAHHQRALAKVRPPNALLDQPFAAVTDNDVSSAAVSNALTPVAEVASPGAGEQFGPGSGSGFGGGPGGGFIFPGGGGGGVVVPPPIPPVTSAVPEPSTWALMLMGFWGIGASLRSRRRKARTGTGAITATVAAK